jgi:hypothetical protein
MIKMLTQIEQVVGHEDLQSDVRRYALAALDHAERAYAILEGAEESEVM